MQVKKFSLFIISSILPLAAVFGAIRLMKSATDKTEWADIQKVFLGLVQRGALNCVNQSDNQMKAVKRVVCEMALTTATGICPDVPTMIKSIGNDFLVCMRTEVPKLISAHCNQMFTIEIQVGKEWKTVKDAAIRPKELFDALNAEVKAKTGKSLSVEDMPGIEKIPWLAPLIRYVMNVDSDLADKNAAADSKAETATAEATEVAGEAIEEAKDKPKKGFIDTINDSLSDFGVDKKLGSLMARVSRANMLNMVLNGWGMVKDAICEVIWAAAVENVMFNVKSTAGNIKIIAQEGLLMLPDGMVSKSKALENYKKVLEAAEAERLKQEAARKKKGAWGAFIARAIFYKTAKPLQPPVDGRIYEYNEAVAKKEIQDLITFTTSPMATSLWFMKDYEMKTITDANTKDILRAIRHASDYCQAQFHRPDMRTLMCDRGNVMKLEKERALVRLAIRLDNERIDRIRAKKLNKDEEALYGKCVGKIDPALAPVDENNAKALAEFNAKATVISKQIRDCLDPTGHTVGQGGAFDVAKFKARLEEIIKQLNGLMDQPVDHEHAEQKAKTVKAADKTNLMIDNPMKRHLIIKGALYTQCVRVQAAHAMYDVKKSAKFPSVTFEQRLQLLRELYSKAAQMKQLMEMLCGEPMQPQFDDYLDPKLMKQPETAILLGNINNKSFATKFLAMILISLPDSKNQLPSAKVKETSWWWWGGY